MIDFSVFWTVARYLGWPLVPSNVLAWLVAVSFSYVMNSFITFGPELGRVLRWRDYLTFVVSGVAGMVASTATLFALSYRAAGAAAKLISILVQLRGQFLAVAFRRVSRRASRRPSAAQSPASSLA